MKKDTIAAISTGMTNSGIGIVRLSGNEALEIADKVYRGKEKITEVPSHTIHYGHIADGEETVDEVLMMVMHGPRTFTGEDTVEINCHGGTYVVSRVLETVLKYGARAAEPGEFTKRAFLNGKMDLSQAEAVIDLINSENEYALQSSVSQLKGSVKSAINELRSKILYHTAFIETALDDPEHISVDGYGEILKGVSEEIIEKLQKLIDSADDGRIMKEGIQTVIVGKPNAGKSSLLNLLAGHERAIVTDIAGTTRDVVEGSIRLNDIVLNMIDTAGIRETEDKIEHMGVKKSLSLIDQADLVLVVLDGSRPLEAEDKELLERTEGLNRIVLINKSDKGCVIDTEGIHISAKENHIDELIQHIKDEFDFSAITNSQAQVLANQRQVQLLEKASQSLNVAIQAMEDGIPTDLIVTDLYDSWENLKEILGEQAKEDLLDELFKRFCIGK